MRPVEVLGLSDQVGPILLQNLPCLMNCTGTWLFLGLHFPVGRDRETFLVFQLLGDYIAFVDVEIDGEISGQSDCLRF